jgi:hypothetical protein
MKALLYFLCLVALAQNAEPYKILTWNKTLLTDKVLISNQTALLDRFFHGDSGFFGVS